MSPREVEGFGVPVLAMEAVRWGFTYGRLGARFYDGYTPNCEALRSVWAASSAVK